MTALSIPYLLAYLHVRYVVPFSFYREDTALCDLQSPAQSTQLLSDRGRIRTQSILKAAAHCIRVVGHLRMTAREIPEPWAGRPPGGPS